MLAGTIRPGALIADLSLVRKYTRSLLTGVVNGAPRCFQSGISSSRARVSSTAPERMWAPISEPFSNRQTLMSRSCCCARVLRCMAVARPAGPPPTNDHVIFHNVTHVISSRRGFSHRGHRNFQLRRRCFRLSSSCFFLLSHCLRSPARFPRPCDSSCPCRPRGRRQGMRQIYASQTGPDPA